MKSLVVFSLLLITVGGARLDGLDGGDHHHDHDHHDFPLATGREAKEASVRLLEFFDAVENEESQFPSDMPLYNELPRSFQFTCDGRLPGYYADVDFGCQVYHMCREDPEHGVATFLCPNATIFHQAIFSCDWWFNVDCQAAPDFYYLNENIYKDPEEEENTNAVQQQTFSQFDSRPVRSADAKDFPSLSLDLQKFVIPVPQASNNEKALNSVGPDYLPPVDGYLPPDTGYLPPDDGYLPPKKEYLPPKKEYLPPN